MLTHLVIVRMVKHLIACSRVDATSQASLCFAEANGSSPEGGGSP